MNERLLPVFLKDTLAFIARNRPSAHVVIEHTNYPGFYVHVSGPSENFAKFDIQAYYSDETTYGLYLDEIRDESILNLEIPLFDVVTAILDGNVETREYRYNENPTCNETEVFLPNGNSLKTRGFQTIFPRRHVGTVTATQRYLRYP